MAHFTGSGNFIIPGVQARAYDLELGQIGGAGLRLSNADGYVDRVRGSVFIASRTLISNSHLNRVGIAGNEARIVGCRFTGGTSPALTIVGHNSLVVGNFVAASTGGGVSITGDQNMVEANTFTGQSGFSPSAVAVVSGDCNKIVGNSLGDPSQYTVGAIDDNGTNTQLTYPNDPTYGDNFSTCVTSP